MTAPHLSRRTVLAGGAAMAFLAACGGDDGDGASATDDDVASSGDELAGTLLVLLPQQGVLTTLGPQRVPVAIADAEGVPVRDGLEARDFEIRAEGRTPVTVTVEPHDDGVPTPYYPVIFAPAGPGIHEIVAVGTEFNAITFDIGETSAIPGLGQILPPVDTPTTASAGGVDPICTRTPACDLHEISLTDALAAGGPVALSIATPEFCQTAVCGPVLDLLIEALPDFPTITGIHAEVYADPRGADDPTVGGLAPIAEQYALPFEPTLYLIDAGGVVISRIDSVYDRVELREALELIA